MPHHLAILTDFPEEGGPSMDLCGDMLLDHLPRGGGAVRRGGLPPFRRLAHRHRITYICRRNADRREAMQAEAVGHELGQAAKRRRAPLSTTPANVTGSQEVTPQ